MIVGFAEELHTAGLSESLEAVEHFRSIAVKLLESRTGNRESDLQLAL